MKKGKKRGIAMFAAVLFIAAVCAGCAEKKEAVKEAELITVWYQDEKHAAFLVQCAKDYYEKTGVQVQVEKQEEPEYLENIYDRTMENGEFPDVYLSSTDQIEKCVLAGIVEKNENEQAYTQAGVNEKAIAASRYEDVMYGSPFSFSTVVLAVHSGYFEQPPATMMDMAAYASEHEFENEEEVLFTWQVNDILSNYCFISNFISLEEKRNNGYSQTVSEEITKSYEVLGNLWKTAAVSEADTQEDVIEAFNNDLTMCALIRSDSVKQLQGEYEIWKLPLLAEDIPTSPMSVVDTLMVNPYSEKKEAAAAFADFAALEDDGILRDTNAGMPLREELLESEEEKLIYEQLNHSDIKPAEMEAESFLSYLQTNFLEHTSLYSQEE
ncbi:MAG: extracellular solute-binding protein [Eubacterium sp.]|nr:extracellular solute-binding protein [Eubacterium sp.]